MSQSIIWHAEDISCNHCAMTIKRELGKLHGLTVQVDVPTKTITIDYQDEATLAKAKQVLDEIGYPVTER